MLESGIILDAKFARHKKRILVTGGTGFIGRQILASLQNRDIEVFAISRKTQNATGVQMLICDLFDPRAIEAIVNEVKPDVVLHNAWFVEHGKFWNSLENLNCVSATLSLARACINNSIKRFVGVGTCFEYAWPEKANCDEAATPSAGHLLYDHAKLAARDLLNISFGNSDVSFAWARVFFTYGPHEFAERLVPSIARALITGSSAKCSSGLAVRDFMDVRDVGAAIAALALCEIEGDVNISSAKATRIAEVAQTLGSLAGRPDLIKLGAYPDRPEPPFIVGSNDRLTNEVMFKPSYSLETGLADALAFWKSQLSVSA